MTGDALHDPYNGDTDRLAADAAAYRERMTPHATRDRLIEVPEDMLIRIYNTLSDCLCFPNGIDAQDKLVLDLGRIIDQQAGR